MTMTKRKFRGASLRRFNERKNSRRLLLKAGRCSIVAHCFNRHASPRHKIILQVIKRSYCRLHPPLRIMKLLHFTVALYLNSRLVLATGTWIYRFGHIEFRRARFWIGATVFVRKDRA
jgi:hypothetical protein